jgi:hypothetical protein
MQSEKINPVDHSAVSIASGAGQQEQISITGAYTFECFDADGKLETA